ncbi:MAG: DUF2834 domain-containing protein [Henriciella sp.]|nr:DUF2834 domain-containing protein [Henriciella sp.]
MSKSIFESVIAGLSAAFAVLFAIIVVPPLLQSGDVFGAFAAGFVNPFSTGYSLDVILCALILFAWIIHERGAAGIKHGWIAIPLSFVPGVATGFAFYLVLRSRQLAAHDR